MRRALILGLLMLFSSSYAHAQSVCALDMLKDQKLTLADMYVKAEAKARAWKPDVVLARISNTNLGPLDEAGKSAAWNVAFFSPSPKAEVLITTFRGMFNCSASADDGRLLPEVKPTFLKDGARLYALAAQNGGPFIAQGYIVQIGTAIAREDRHTTWNITYTKDNKNAPVMVLVNANTGAVEKVIKN